MKTTTENNTLILCPAGRIDTANAAEIEKEITAAVEAAGAIEAIVIDAKELLYISSAGLRVLLRLLKGTDKNVQVINASSELYDIFEVTGFTELLDVKKALREISIEGCEVIGAGGYGTVYRIDPETIVKVYRHAGLAFIEKERSLSQKAFLLGVPTAISFDTVKVGDKYGVVYEMLDANTVAQLIEANPAALPQLGQLSAVELKKLHGIKADGGEFPNRKEYAKEWIEEIRKYITDEEADAIIAFIDSIPDRDTFLHGDYNSKNVMVKDGEVLLIDIGDAAYGHPAFDIAGLMLAYLILPRSADPERVRALMGFDPALAQNMWGVMCGTYFRTGDPQEIRRITDMLMPLALLMMTYHAFHYGVMDEETIRIRVERLIRGQLLPAIKGAAPIDF
jgi:uncharacterized protein (TIGR02172 family)